MAAGAKTAEERTKVKIARTAAKTEVIRDTFMRKSSLIIEWRTYRFIGDSTKFTIEIDWSVLCSLHKSKCRLFEP
ncbi:MAG: hypothetical protein J7647_08135 [Cyanobacteria bacterium SBLK]|nr:hypothetical protein [Cyanobacteria bacterium SBLK]